MAIRADRSEDSHDLVIMAVIVVARRVARGFDANADWESGPRTRSSSLSDLASSKFLSL